MSGFYRVSKTCLLRVTALYPIGSHRIGKTVDKRDEMAVLMGIPFGNDTCDPQDSATFSGCWFHINQYRSTISIIAMNLSKLIGLTI